MSVPARNSNGGNNPFRWDEFDALPPVVRRVLQFAPIQLGTHRAAVGLRAGLSPEEVAREEIRVARRALRRLVLVHYGPEHPEISHVA